LNPHGYWCGNPILSNPDDGGSHTYSLVPSQDDNPNDNSMF
jgi:hypothetical protein